MFDSIEDVVEESNKQPREHDVRGNSEVEGWKTNPQFGESFLRHCFEDSLEHVFVRISTIWQFGLFLHFSFGIVERQTHECSQKSGYQCCLDTYECSLFFRSIVMDQSLFGFIKWSQHSQIQYHCSDDGGTRSFPQSHDTFVFDDLCESICEIFVSSFGLSREGFFCLQSDQYEISGISHQRSYESSCCCINTLPCQIDFVVSLLVVIEQVFVDTHSGGCVGDLTNEC